MCAPKPSLKKRKKSLLIKILGKPQGRVHHATLLRSEFFIYDFLGFVQTFRRANFIVPKNQAKSLKTICEELRFYCNLQAVRLKLC